MRDILCFRKMITPMIVQFLFWLAVFASVLLAVLDFFRGQYFVGIQLIILGPLLARVVAEMILVLFQIYNTLVKILEKERS